jgi:hypothetical protein
MTLGRADRASTVVGGGEMVEVDDVVDRGG